ncbi:MAG: 2-hydroxychromene-2-carboxylate isomerase [bacterium]
MTKQVDFYFDFGSPNAYLAYTQLPAVAERTGAEITWRPMLLGGVFKATGNVSPATVPAKRAFMEIETERFIRRHGIPFARNPHFPVNTLTLMRGAAAHQLHGDFPRYVKTCFEAMWVNPRDLNDPSEVEAMLGEAGFDLAQFRAWVEDPSVKDALRAQTEAAVARGVFGAPTFFVGGEMFFGKDQLEMVEQALGEQALGEEA